MITAAQSRAARALLNWSQADLAVAAHLGLSTVRDFEKGRRTPTHNNHLGLKTALEASGITFISVDEFKSGSGCGVRFTVEPNEFSEEAD